MLTSMGNCRSESRGGGAGEELLPPGPTLFGNAGRRPNGDAAGAAADNEK